jgi:hypothetical protein
MKLKHLIPALLVIAVSTISVNVQSEADTTSKNTERKYQAKAPKTQPFGKEAFGPSKITTDAGWGWLVF